MSLVLDSYLDAADGDVRRTILAIAKTAVTMKALLAGETAGLDQVVAQNASGDGQKKLDVIANDLFEAALKAVGVGVLVSEEVEEPVVLNPGGSIAVATDPLDGSSNIGLNMSIGTIFAIYRIEEGKHPVLRPGREQLAAGFVVYGVQTDLVLTIGKGSYVFTYLPDSGVFASTGTALSIPAKGKELAVNASNAAYWPAPIAAFVGECFDPAHGYNMRWNASMVADAFRILKRGGVFLYPGDGRQGYAMGRIRLAYEANPIAFVVEQAGGKATDGVHPILDIVGSGIHDRTPVCFGSPVDIARLAALHETTPA